MAVASGTSSQLFSNHIPRLAVANGTSSADPAVIKHAELILIRECMSAHAYAPYYIQTIVACVEYSLSAE